MKKFSLKKQSIVLAVGTAIMVTTQGCHFSPNAKQSPPNATTQQATPRVTTQQAGHGQVIADTAKALVGKNYASGALGAESFTPAGFVKYVYGKSGIKTSDDINQLMTQGEKVDPNALKPGDLVFFQSTSSPSEAGPANYVGIYVGNNQFVFAEQESDQIRIDHLSGRFKAQFAGARRYNTNGASLAEGSRVEPALPLDLNLPNMNQPNASQSNLGQSNVKQPFSVQSTQQGTIGKRVVQAGLKYLGVPYEYGSSRYSKTTMDCSEFTMWAYREGANIDMGRGGAQSQFRYVQNHGHYSYNINNLKVGDLIFFMNYKGWRASDYQGIVASRERIGHVGIYMGNNQVLHTYSKKAGGVKITKFRGTSWGYRFIVGGRPY
jgi:cell wall-associated NlpC family hydrolase